MKLAVFYHCWLPNDRAAQIALSQAQALWKSGLACAASDIRVGYNGPREDIEMVQSLVGSENVESDNGNKGESATIQILQRWLPSHPDWLVCYHHIKGASGNSEYGDAWRRCMERAVIWNWKTCVNDLASGRETVGVHWFNHQDQQYWAGNFWWATANYLSSLPAIDTKTASGKSYESEAWIGKCGRRPRIFDYARHPVMSGCR